MTATEKKCDLCKRFPPLYRERYCGGCRPIMIETMKEAGYLRYEEPEQQTPVSDDDGIEDLMFEINESGVLPDGDDE